MTAKDKPADPGKGIIDNRKVYTVNAFCSELGIKRNGAAYQRLRRMGLPIRLGKYIRGKDFMDLLGKDDGSDSPEEA